MATGSSLLPTFMIIGAAKAGTTTLFDALNQHPQVFCSTPKETHFFSDDAVYAKGLDWYRDVCFKNSKDHPVRGEATPQYLSLSEKAVPRIQNAFQGEPLKFIAIFRDPVRRAYSHYWQAVRYGNESLSFEDALAAEDDRLGKARDDLSVTEVGTFAYFRLGCYASRLKPFLDQFSRDRFLFLLNENLESDFAGALAKTAAFLGVDASFKFQPVVSNPAAMPRNRFLFGLLDKTSPIRKLVRAIVPVPALRDNLKESYRKAVIKPFTYPTMDQKTGQILRVRYAEQITQLEQITGFDLSGWQAKA